MDANGQSERGCGSALASRSLAHSLASCNFRSGPFNPLKTRFHSIGVEEKVEREK